MAQAYKRWLSPTSGGSVLQAVAQAYKRWLRPTSGGSGVQAMWLRPKSDMAQTYKRWLRPRSGGSGVQAMWLRHTSGGSGLKAVAKAYKQSHYWLKSCSQHIDEFISP